MTKVSLLLSVSAFLMLDDQRNACTAFAPITSSKARSLKQRQQQRQASGLHVSFIDTSSLYDPRDWPEDDSEELDTVYTPAANKQQQSLPQIRVIPVVHCPL